MRITGELIIGINEIDESTFYGKTDTNVGTFPLSRTWKLDSSILKVIRW